MRYVWNDVEKICVGCDLQQLLNMLDAWEGIEF